MSLKIATVKLNEMTSKVMQAVGNNAMLPITGLMNISSANGELCLATTDGLNYLYISEPVTSEDFYVTVYADAFSKLISKITSEFVVLELKETNLEVRGNGKYSLSLPLDENGNIIRFSVFEYAESDVQETGFINLTDIKSIVNSLRPSLAVTMEEPMYTNYYSGDKVIATDTYNIASKDIRLFNTELLLSAKTMELLSILEEEKIEYEIENDNTITFLTNHAYLVSRYYDVGEYPIDVISSLIDSEFSHVCQLSKPQMLQALDRILLFVGKYDNNAINLNFTEDGLVISSKTSSGVEILDYLSDSLDAEFVCDIDIKLLQAQIKAQSTDTVELWYGQSNCIKLVDDDIKMIVALTEE